MMSAEAQLLPPEVKAVADSFLTWVTNLMDLQVEAEWLRENHPRSEKIVELDDETGALIEMYDDIFIAAQEKMDNLGYTMELGEEPMSLIITPKDSSAT